jgi:hypothetical protein
MKHPTRRGKARMETILPKKNEMKRNEKRVKGEIKGTVKGIIVY